MVIMKQHSHVASSS